MISEFNTSPNDITKELSNIQLKHPRIKMEKIDELKNLDATLGIFQKLIDIFFNEYSNRIPEMKTHCKTKDYENLSRIIHRFKSTTYNLGAARAVEITKLIEATISNPRKLNADLELLLEALEQECKKAHEQLKSYS